MVLKKKKVREGQELRRRSRVGKRRERRKGKKGSGVIITPNSKCNTIHITCYTISIIPYEQPHTHNTSLIHVIPSTKYLIPL